MDAWQGKVIRPFLGKPHSRAFKDKQAGELRWAFQSEAAASCAKAKERYGFLGRGKWSVQMLPPPLRALTSLLSHCSAQSAGSTDHVTPLSSTSRSLLQCPEASPTAASFLSTQMQGFKNLSSLAASCYAQDFRQATPT